MDRQQLKKKQEELDNEILKCPKCGQDAYWGEIRDFDNCLDCYFNYFRAHNNPRKLKVAKN